MTCEVLIMNQNCVALAADSLATFENGKTVDSNDKLYMISNNPPIGLMIYGATTFSNKSIETIINKVIRKTNIKKIDNIIKIKKEFIKEIEKECADMDINNYLNNFEKYINKKIIDRGEKHTIQLIKTSNKKKIMPFLKRNKYNETFNKIISLLKNKLKLEELKKYFTRYIESISTGIVIAGINKNEDYPSFTSFNLYFKYNGKVFLKENKTMLNTGTVCLETFAQYNRKFNKWNRE